MVGREIQIIDVTSNRIERNFSIRMTFDFLDRMKVALLYQNPVSYNNLLKAIGSTDKIYAKGNFENKDWADPQQCDFYDGMLKVII